MKIRTIKQLNIQLAIGTLLALAGLTMLFIGLFMDPTGIIDSSVLVAFGEVSTFSAGLLGVDYHYSYKEYMVRHRYGRLKEEREENEEDI